MFFPTRQRRALSSSEPMRLETRSMIDSPVEFGGKFAWSWSASDLVRRIMDASGWVPFGRALPRAKPRKWTIV